MKNPNKYPKKTRGLGQSPKPAGEASAYKLDKWICYNESCANKQKSPCLECWHWYSKRTYPPGYENENVSGGIPALLGAGAAGVHNRPERPEKVWKQLEMDFTAS